MIRLTNNQENIVYLTLSEAVTLTATPVYFLFRFLSETTQDEILFTAEDITSAITRYNEFAITLTGATSPNINYTGGTISMSPFGEWIYEVYEMYDPANLFLSGTSGTIIETGIVSVSGATANTLINQVYTGSPTTFGFYQG